MGTLCIDQLAHCVSFRHTVGGCWGQGTIGVVSQVKVACLKENFASD